MVDVALGVRVHSGWAMVVGVAAPCDGPSVVARRRIEIADPQITGSKQPYHAAVQRDMKNVEGFLERCAETTSFLAEQALRAIIGELKKSGYSVRAAGMLAGSSKALPALATILASHALIHTAEGEFFRRALTQAIERCGTSLTQIFEREVWARSAAKLSRPLEELQRYVAAMGQPLGPPWRQDEKRAALAGWLALLRVKSGS